MQIEEDEGLIESFTGLSIDGGKQGFRNSLKDRSRLRELVRHVNRTNLAQMSNASVLDFWFIALKQNYPRELFRLYELNQFMSYHQVMITNGGDNTFDGILNGIYRETLMPIDETIFYPIDFIDEHFRRDAGTVDYFSRFVLNIGYEDLYTRVIDPVKDKAYLLDKMSRTSLNFRYASAKGNYMRLAQYGEVDRYTIGHVADRAFLYYVVAGLYIEIRRQIDANPMMYDGREEEQMKARIRDQFKTIGRLYTNTAYVSVDRETVMEALLPDFKKAVENFVETKMPAIYDNRRAHYSTLFENDHLDNELKLDRQVFSWMLPFNVTHYRDKRRVEGAITYEQVEAEIKTILLQESMLWVNMLIYEMHIADIVSDKKRPGDSDSDSESNKKKVKMGRAMIVEQSDRSNLLSILHGNGTLSVFFGRGKQSESYRISVGDNVKLPCDTIDYHIQYDDEEEEEDEMY